MESVKDLVAVIRLRGELPTAEGLRVDVAVDGTRKAYGRIDYRVSTLQLQLLERWSSLLLRTFASMMAEHATTEPVRSEFIAFYVALAKLHGHVRNLRAESDQPAHAAHT